MRIVIAYDGSRGADSALDDLARAGLPSEGEALVLAAADVPWDTTPTEEGSLAGFAAGRHGRGREWFAREDALAAAARGEQRFHAKFPSWRVAHESVAGHAAAIVTDRAAAWNADLVVVGSHAKPSHSRTAFGSVARRIASTATCSVRVGRGRPERPRDGVRIVVGVDGSPDSDAAVAAAAGRSWPAGSGAVVVCAVDADVSSFDAPDAPGARGTSVPWKSLRDLVHAAADRLRAAGLETAPRLLEGEARRLIVAEAESVAADVLFLGARGRGRRKASLLGSVSESVVAHAPCSVEVVRRR